MTTILRPGTRVLFDGEVGVPTIGHVSCRWWTRWWDPDNEGLSVWGAWQAKGAPSQTLSYKDLSGNGRDLTVGSAPSWSKSAGWTFNGSTHYLKTTFVPDSDQSQTMIAQFSGYDCAGTSAEVLAGMTNDPAVGTVNFSLHLSWDTDRYGYRNGSYKIVPGGQRASGNLCVAGDTGYYNGSSEVTSIEGWTDTPNRTIYIGARNHGNDSPYYFAAFTLIAIAIYGGTLTGTQVAKVASAMADI
jgi:hypothetical protein